MKIRTIELDDDETPDSITVEMSIGEAYFIAKAIGKMNGAAMNEVMPSVGDTVASGVYNALTGGVFNRFWDGGVDDFKAFGQ